MNKNISVWRGTLTPPTNYHLWLRDESDLLFKDEDKWKSIAATDRFINLENIVFKDNTTISITASKYLIDKALKTDVTIAVKSDFKKGDEKPKLFINDEEIGEKKFSLSDTTTFKGKAVYSFGELTASTTVTAVNKSYVIVSKNNVTESDLKSGILTTSFKSYKINKDLTVGDSLYLVVPFNNVTTSYKLLGDDHNFAKTEPTKVTFNLIDYYIYTIVSDTKSSGNFNVILN